MHIWHPEEARYPWSPSMVPAPWPGHTYEELIHAMDDAGVDAALVVTPQLHGADNRYSTEARARYPDRLGVIGRVDEAQPDLDAMARWRATHGMLGFRLLMTKPGDFAAALAPPLSDLLSVAERNGVPLCIYPGAYLKSAEQVVRAHPKLTIVIDHLGITQRPDAEGGPWAALEDLLNLAKYENVYVKFSGAPTWSREPFPFADVWRHVEPVFEAFGVRRLMWGSDFTHLGARIPYADAVGFVLATPTLSRSEKEALMGGTLERVFRWEPANREPMGTGGSDPAPTV